MTIDDVCDASHGERTRLAMEQWHGKNFSAKNLTIQDVEFAERIATAEMLDEIHCMLRHLTIKNREDWRD